MRNLRIDKDISNSKGKGAGAEMEEYWKKFENTGKIEAYLQYKDAAAEQEAVDCRKGDQHYGSEYKSDRDGALRTAYWGI